MIRHFGQLKKRNFTFKRAFLGESQSIVRWLLNQSSSFRMRTFSVFSVSKGVPNVLRFSFECNKNTVFCQYLERGMSNIYPLWKHLKYWVIHWVMFEYSNRRHWVKSFQLRSYFWSVFGHFSLSESLTIVFVYFLISIKNKHYL